MYTHFLLRLSPPPPPARKSVVTFCRVRCIGQRSRSSGWGSGHKPYLNIASLSLYLTHTPAVCINGTESHAHEIGALGAPPLDGQSFCLLFFPWWRRGARRRWGWRIVPPPPRRRYHKEEGMTFVATTVDTHLFNTSSRRSLPSFLECNSISLSTSQHIICVSHNLYHKKTHAALWGYYSEGWTDRWRWLCFWRIKKGTGGILSVPVMMAGARLGFPKELKK